MWRERGFTLLEMLLVIALIALTLTLSLGISSTGNSSVRRSAVSVETAFQAARRRAMVEGRRTYVDLDLAHRTLHVPGEASIALGAVDRIRVTGRRQDLIRGNRARFVFFPDGSATGGQVDLLCGRAMASVSIYWLNGKVELAAAGRGP